MRRSICTWLYMSAWMGVYWFNFTLSTNLDISYSVDAEPGLGGQTTSCCISNTSNRPYIQGYDCTLAPGSKAEKSNQKP